MRRNLMKYLIMNCTTGKVITSKGTREEAVKSRDYYTLHSGMPHQIAVMEDEISQRATEVKVSNAVVA